MIIVYELEQGRRVQNLQGRGAFHDSAEAMQAAIEYVETNRENANASEAGVIVAVFPSDRRAPRPSVIHDVSDLHAIGCRTRFITCTYDAQRSEWVTRLYPWRNP